MAEPGASLPVDDETVEGLGWGVSQILGTVSLPTSEHWLDEAWVAKLFGLARRGVQLEGMLAWAFHVAAGSEPMLDCEETLRRVERKMKEHSLEQSDSREVEAVTPGLVGVVKILGPDLPSAETWGDFAWVRALFELQSRGVELAAFQAWCRDAARYLVAGADLGPLAADDVGSRKKCGDASPVSQEVDGPAQHADERILVDLGRKRKLEDAMVLNVAGASLANVDDPDEVVSTLKTVAEAEEASNVEGGRILWPFVAIKSDHVNP
jgi:hypothetical protein